MLDRKHRAPKGALRHHGQRREQALVCRRQKAPSAKKCIKTATRRRRCSVSPQRQKAPSAKRCIKTTMSSPAGITGVDVRKHRAPKGALRLVLPLALGVKNPNMVRKHRAPKGALRPIPATFKSSMHTSQKAPSAKRCIKTQ